MAPGELKQSHRGNVDVKAARHTYRLLPKKGVVGELHETFAYVTFGRVKKILEVMQPEKPHGLRMETLQV